MDAKRSIEKSKYSKGWLWKMAWRDSRRSRGKLILFTSSIVIGIAALVAINSFKENLEEEIDRQAKTLLGADLLIGSNKSFTEEIRLTLDSIGNEHSQECSFASMIYFPRTMGTRLVQVRALSGPYPYYGSIETEPRFAGGDFQNGKYALVDEKLMLQYNVDVGDDIKVGEVLFKITGKLQKVPGQSGVTSSISPVVYIPYYYLNQTGLIKKGSRIQYSYYYRFSNDIELKSVLDKYEKRLRKLSFKIDTVEERKEDTSSAFKNMAIFLNLSAFIALLLGSIGVAGAVHIYLKEKTESVAVLRCLGLKGNQAFYIYFYQVVIMGALGSFVGVVLGSAIQFLIPALLKDILPITIVPKLYWYIILEGLALGLFIAVLFALLPLISLRKISPLLSIRLAYDDSSKPKTSVQHYIIYTLIILFIYGFSFFQIGDPLKAFYFCLGLLATFVLLWSISLGLMKLTKKISNQKWNYVTRQGIANLYRPNNQSILLVITIGLCTVLLSTLFFMRYLVIDQISITGRGERPNMVLFDIQSDQKEEIKALTIDYDLPIVQEVPVVTMRLKELNGVNKSQADKDTTLNYPDWMYNREYRITFRDSLIDSETIIKGKWQGVVENSSDSIFVSVADGFAENLKLKLGDELLFNVQGALIKTYIGSLREIDWRRVQTNFLIVFPKGVLEEAPQFHVLITKVDKSDVSARYQQAVVRSYPNISIIDLELILKTVDDVLGKISFVINFMAAFSIITGFIVLAGSVILSKSQRIQESVLLRTLGAVRKQIFAITTIEYFVLGSLAAITGLIIAHTFSWAIAQFMFESSYNVNLLPTLIIFLIITFSTVLLGWSNIRPVLKSSPLKILRKEA
ncbi:MAG: putative ABC transport system permease protein [Cyclobacteriaceae bacterium]